MYSSSSTDLAEEVRVLILAVGLIHYELVWFKMVHYKVYVESLSDNKLIIQFVPPNDYCMYNNNMC